MGKFSHGHPKIEEVRRFFLSLGLKQNVSVGLLDSRHVLIRFLEEQDFHRVWSRGLWHIGKFPMRTFRWSPNFHVGREYSLVSVWFSFPNLPIHLFDKNCLFSIANAFGNLLFVDAATASLIRPSVARICVEVDLLRLLPEKFWIGMEGSPDGFWQRIVPENLPKYCSKCWHISHSIDQCSRDGANVVGLQSTLRVD